MRFAGRGADEAMIDGEAVVFLDDGQSDFHALLTTETSLVTGTRGQVPSLG